MGVAPSTVRRRVQDHTTSNYEVHLLQLALLPHYESELADKCRELEFWCFPLTYAELKAMAEELVGYELGKHQVSRFLDRHNLQSVFLRPIDLNRAFNHDLLIIIDFINLLRPLFNKINVRAHQIYNIDEKGVLLGKA